MEKRQQERSGENREKITAKIRRKKRKDYNNDQEKKVKRLQQRLGENREKIIAKLGENWEKNAGKIWIKQKKGQSKDQVIIEKRELQ